MRWDNMVVECVLDERRFIRDAPQAHEVRVVLGEQQLGIHRVFLTFGTVVDRLAVGSDRRGGRKAIQVCLPELVVNCSNLGFCGGGQIRALLRWDTPRPGVRKPQLRDDMQIGRIGTAIICGDTDVNVIRTILVLCVLETRFHENYCLRVRKVI
jgi:hypothetical protein